MYFLRLWYSFLDRMNDRKFKTIFISSCVGFGVLVAAMIATVIIVNNNNDKDVMSPNFSADNETILVNGVDISGMSEAEIEEAFNEFAQDYSLSVLIDGKEVGVIEGKNIDLKYNSECDLEEHLNSETEKEKANSVLEDATEEYSTEEINKDTEDSENNILIENIWVYNEEKLDTQVKTIVAGLGGAELTSDLVNIEYSAELGYSLSVSEDRKFIDTEAVITEIKLALEDSAESVELDNDKIYFSDNNALIEGDERLKKTVETLNLYAGSVLNYDFNGQLMVIDKAKTNSWFYLDQDFNVNVDEDAVQIYANKLAEDFTDYSGTLPFLTSYGTTVNFRTASSKQVDMDTLFSYLVEDVKKGTTVSRTIPYVDTGLANVDSTFGGTYVEINLTKQHLFFYYQGNLIVDCDIVSGSVDKGYATPGGIFTLRYKKQNATLNGADYSTPVDYWMPFNGGIGMHDANWRTEFGGSIYLTDGSHGCINMPTEAVAKVFEYAYPGMYVIVYGGAYSLDDAAAQEALNPQTTEASTEATTVAVTTEVATRAEVTSEAVASTEITTEEVKEPVSTEAKTEPQSETSAETEVPTAAPVETTPAETETSGENTTEGSNV